MNIFQTIQIFLSTANCSRNHQHANDRQLNSAQTKEDTEMKMFQTIRKNFAAMGFTPNQRQKNRWRLSSGQIIGVVKCSLDAISLGIYFFREANDINEYIECGFSLTVAVGFTIVLTSFVFKNDKLFNMLDLAAKEENFS